MGAVTLEYAQQMLTLWQECERALAEGQAKSYRIGTREYTALDMNEISSRIRYWENQVNQLSGQARRTRVVRFVPRDM